MKLKACIAALAILTLFACNDEGEVNSSIIGVWSGDRAEFKINPDGVIPAFTLNEDTIPVQVEFQGDGTVHLTDNDGARTSGTYTLSGRDLTLGIDYEFELIGLDGTYDVEELTDSNLRIKITKDGSYTDPDTNQTIEGEVEATLYFVRQ